MSPACSSLSPVTSPGITQPSRIWHDWSHIATCCNDPRTARPAQGRRSPPEFTRPKALLLLLTSCPFHATSGPSCRDLCQLCLHTHPEMTTFRHHSPPPTEATGPSCPTHDCHLSAVPTSTLASHDCQTLSPLGRAFPLSPSPQRKSGHSLPVQVSPPCTGVPRPARPRGSMCSAFRSHLGPLHKNEASPPGGPAP